MSDTRIEQFKNMTEADPENELGHFSLGKAYLDAGQFDDAAASLRRVLELNAEFSKAYALLGQGYADLAQQVDRDVSRFILGDALVEPNSFHKLVAQGVDRAERSHRLLEYQGDLGATNLAHLPAVGLERSEIDDLRITVGATATAVKQYLPFHDSARPVEYLHDRPSGYGFATTAFSNNS